jgi:hypothetical protein
MQVIVRVQVVTGSAGYLKGQLTTGGGGAGYCFNVRVQVVTGGASYLKGQLITGGAGY